MNKKISLYRLYCYRLPMVLKFYLCQTRWFSPLCASEKSFVANVSFLENCENRINYVAVHIELEMFIPLLKAPLWPNYHHHIVSVIRVQHVLLEPMHIVCFPCSPLRSAELWVKRRPWATCTCLYTPREYYSSWCISVLPPAAQDKAAQPPAQRIAFATTRSQSSRQFIPRAVR